MQEVQKIQESVLDLQEKIEEKIKERTQVEEIFYQNDIAVTKTIIKILRWLILVPPALLLLSLLGIFNIKPVDLIPIFILTLIVTMGPTVMAKLKVPTAVLKYTVIISLAILVSVMGTNISIGIYMTYAFAMVFSLMYYDKKFTLRISIISYVLLVISLYFRSFDGAALENMNQMSWFIGRIVGFLIETVVMTLACVNIAGASHKMLSKLGDTQKVAGLVDKCNGAAVDLGKVVENLQSCVNDLKGTTQVITASARETKEDCNSSLSYVDTV